MWTRNDIVTVFDSASPLATVVANMEIRGDGLVPYERFPTRIPLLLPHMLVVSAGM
jgi:hypothetical protein